MHIPEWTRGQKQGRILSSCTVHCLPLHGRLSTEPVSEFSWQLLKICEIITALRSWDCFAIACQKLWILVWVSHSYSRLSSEHILRHGVFWMFSRCYTGNFWWCCKWQPKSFSALTLMGGSQAGNSACKNLAAEIQVLCNTNGRPDPAWPNLEKTPIINRSVKRTSKAMIVAVVVNDIRMRREQERHNVLPVYVKWCEWV